MSEIDFYFLSCTRNQFRTTRFYIFSHYFFKDIIFCVDTAVQVAQWSALPKRTIVGSNAPQEGSFLPDSVLFSPDHNQRLTPTKCGVGVSAGHITPFVYRATETSSKLNLSSVKVTCKFICTYSERVFVCQVYLDKIASKKSY